MNKSQFYAQLDACKLSLNSMGDILIVPIGQSTFSPEVIRAANMLTEKTIAQLSRALQETDFEELEGDEED